jgi:serine protease Do
MVAGRLLHVSLLAFLAASASAGACSAPARAPAPSSSPPAAAGPTTPQIADLRTAVFEVVVPKYEPAGLQYAEPLPVHLLPHHERTEAYLSIGTAFTLDGTTFVSAAHVFTLHGVTQFAERRLRGADGTVYEIDQFVAHSGVRDLVAFTLRTPPAVAKPLARGTRPEIGATVYTVGNALGEGLSVRGGNVASFTPEPLESAWEFIRYSAPASPGNSGGPLLDQQGRVTGIVVQRSSEENLNFAVPIEELDRLPATSADFFARIGEYEADHKLYMDWRFETALPADYATLAANARASYYEAYRTNRRAFVEKFRDQMFPGAAELRTFLREQSTYYFPAELVREPSGRWTLSEPSSQSSYEVTGNQSIYFGKTGEYVYAVLERPADVPLATFLAEPRRVMEQLLRTLNIGRTYGGAQIRITTYGEPHHQETWRDDLGRPWTTVTWRLYADASSTLHCTPYPRGLACIMQDTATEHEPFMVEYARINARRWTLSYDGRVRDWVEFMALDPALRPTFLSGSVTLTGPRLAATLGPITIAASNPGFTEDSLLFAEVAYTSIAPPTLQVSGVGLRTKVERGLGLRIERIAEPLPAGMQGMRDFWDELVAKKAPYDGKIVRDGESSNMMLVEAAAPRVLGPDTNVAARSLISCWTGDNVAISDATLEKACTTFRKSLTISAD